jgi:hypothetical protein
MCSNGNSGLIIATMNVLTEKWKRKEEKRKIIQTTGIEAFKKAIIHGSHSSTYDIKQLT